MGGVGGWVVVQCHWWRCAMCASLPGGKIGLKGRQQFFRNTHTHTHAGVHCTPTRPRSTRTNVTTNSPLLPRPHSPHLTTSPAMTLANGVSAIPTGQPLADVTKIASSSSADAEAYLYSNDTRVTGYEPLISPGLLIHEIPVPPQAQRVIAKARGQASAIINGKDDRLLVVVGPCSIHDPEQAKVYAQRLAQSIQTYQEDLVIVMRAYFEKPRTTVGWKGLINDPDINGTFQINRGLKVGRMHTSSTPGKDARELNTTALTSPSPLPLLLYRLLVICWWTSPLLACPSLARCWIPFHPSTPLTCTPGEPLAPVPPSRSCTGS